MDTLSEFDNMNSKKMGESYMFTNLYLTQQQFNSARPVSCAP